MTSNARTAPDHDRCDTHKHYRLNCAQYENLLTRSGQKCEICGTSGILMPQEKLHIDHDITPWGVRGLLCLRCNTVLGQTKDRWPDGQEYLANSWWRTRCAALGIPAELGPEPEIGSAIRNQFGTVWMRSSDERWEAPTQDGHHPPPKSWRELYHSYGAHNLVPYDLKSAHKDGSLPWDVKYALESGHGWSAVRSLIGLPEPAPRRRIREWQPRDGLPWLETPEKTAEAMRRLLTPGECRRIAELLQADGESDTARLPAALTTD